MKQTQPWHNSFDNPEIDEQQEKIAQLFMDKLNEQPAINEIDEILQLIKSEIKYCNQQPLSNDVNDLMYNGGIVKGLRQAVTLIEKYQKKEYKEKTNESNS